MRRVVAVSNPKAIVTQRDVTRIVKGAAAAGISVVHASQDVGSSRPLNARPARSSRPETAKEPATLSRAAGSSASSIRSG